MTTLAIVSSYSESCGNAAFTKVLHDSIEQYSNVQVEVIELDLRLLQAIDRRVRRKANVHIKNICQRLKSFDAVNIQLEAALYGTLPCDIVQRVRWIIDANTNTSVTLHSPRILSSSTPADIRVGIKKILKLDIANGIKEAFKYLMDIHIRVNRRLIKYAVLRKCPLIVHTLRARNQIQNFFSDYNRISVHPLKIVPENFSPNPMVLKRIREQLDLSDSDILIGMFGYISPYKGYMDALHAMQYLPPHYKLLIFGRQHPQMLKSNGQRDEYLSLLIKTFEANEEWLKDRVFFLGELVDEEFLQVASNINVAWLPYYENGQDGSGIASICLDICKRVICSTSFAFDELFKLIPYNNMMRFDIGNILEIASKTTMIMRRDDSLLISEPSKYDIRTQVLTYLSAIPAALY